MRLMYLGDLGGDERILVKNISGYHIKLSERYNVTSV